MKLGPCQCNPRDYHRIHRSWWMKILFPVRGLFQCAACGTSMLILPQREIRKLP